MAAEPEQKNRVIGLLPAEFTLVQEKLDKKDRAFITTREGVKEEIILTEGGGIVVQSTRVPVVDSEKFMNEHKVSDTSNWYKLILQHGRPMMHVGLIAFFMDKSSQKPIMINTLTDEIMQNILADGAT